MTNKIIKFAALFGLLGALFSGPAFAEEPYIFEKIISTSDQNGENKFVEISAPVYLNQKYYFKTISRGKEGEAFYSLYSYTKEGGLTLILDSSATLPETGDKINGILDFDVRGNEVVFIGLGESSYTLGIYLLKNGNLTRLVGGSKKMPSRSLYFKEINDVMFLGDGILYTGGRVEREGMYYYRGGKSELLIHQPLDVWAGRKKMTHMKAMAISRLNQIDNEVVFSLRRSTGGQKWVEFYTINQAGEINPWKRETLDRKDFSEVFEISAITGTPDYQIFLGFGQDGLGRLFELSGDKPHKLIDNTTALWAPEEMEVGQFSGKEILPGDIIPPSEELFFRKASNSYPFWHNVYTIYEMEGILQPEYINQFAVMDEYLPLYEDYKGGRWVGTLFQAAISYYVGGSVSSSMVISQRNSIFSKHSTRGKMGFYDSRKYSWDNYFQVPLTAGDGGFATNGESTVFHAVNLRNHQGLFLYENGEITKILDNNGTLFGAGIAHLYIGFDAFDGDDIIFWADLTRSETSADQFLVRARKNPNYKKGENE